MGMIQLLQDRDLMDKQRELLTVLNSSSMNLLNLLNDILDYTKIESGHLEFDRAPLSIRDVCESVINEHFDNADEKGIDIAYISESDETDRVISDPLRLRQPIRGYVENAIKFNEGRGVTPCSQA
jgi:two-component system, sensor histidine kinase and response regulator